jgi:hypothetical protein
VPIGSLTVDLYGFIFISGLLPLHMGGFWQGKPTDNSVSIAPCGMPRLLPPSKGESLWRYFRYIADIGLACLRHTRVRRPSRAGLWAMSHHAAHVANTLFGHRHPRNCQISPVCRGPGLATASVLARWPPSRWESWALAGNGFSISKWVSMLGCGGDTANAVAGGPTNFELGLY